MNCERIRWLLSLEPKGTAVPQNPALRCHLDHCSACQAFWQTLQVVDADLATRPLAMPPANLKARVLTAIGDYAQPREIAPPFSRALFLTSAGLILSALVGGALLLHYWSTAPLTSAFSLQLNPTWPTAAEKWLSDQGAQAAQVVLATMVGVIVTIVGIAIGFRASERQTHSPTSRDSTP